MAGQYTRSSSSDSAAPMIGTSPGTEASANSKLILGAVIGGVTLLLSLVSTAGVFVYFTREISKVKNQRASQELWCLDSPNKFQQLISNETEDLSDQIRKDPCWRLANSIKLLANKVADNTSKQRIVKDVMDNLPVDVLKFAAEFEDRPAHRPAAHLTVQFGSPQDLSHHLDRSCRHLVKWGTGKGLSYIQNMTIHHGKLQASQTGRYYIYAQTYFRYQHKGIADYEDYSAKPNEQQLVQCIYKMTTTYASPILLMKSVGTKCWAANAEYGLNSIYQGGLFELKAGDEVFVTISDIKLVDDNVASSYFGCFRLHV
ncbi:TNF superfamily member 10, like [Heterodontus francisci]|uniref:TNF superfamily member 10, like n=1 Tax=Heterodontus francisci TaxID=7792 RepID=UPI00355C152B